MNQKTFISIGFLILIIVIAGVLGYTESPSPPKRLPPQGLYDSCAPSDADCRAHLDKMAKAGFKLVVNYGVFDHDITDIMGYADHAARVGMKVIWDMSSRPYRDGTFSREYIRERVEAVKTHPATWGYYVADEPGLATPNDIWSERGQVKTLSDYVHQLDPAHPRLLVHWYESDPDDPSRPVINLRPYADYADVIALDVYALTVYAPAEDVGEAARAGQKLADEKGKQWAIVLQSFDAAQYPEELPDAYAGWPDRERLLKERNLTLKNSRPAFILWYSYFDILRSPDPAGHWADLVAAAFSPEPSVEPTSMPIFPIGLYAVDALPYSNKVTEEFSDIATAGFNVIQSYQFE